MSRLAGFIHDLPRAALLIFAVAVALRLLVLGGLLMYDGERALIWGDTVRYQMLANSVLEGNGYSYRGEPEAYRPPGYPAFFILVESLHIPFWIAALLQVLVSSLIPVAAYFAALHFLNLRRHFAVLAGLLCAIEPVQAYYGTVLLPDVLFSALFLGGLMLVLKWIEKQDLRLLLSAGILLGLSNYIRPAGLYFVAIMSAVLMLRLLRTRLLKEKFWHVALFVISFVLVLAPWYVRNYAQFGEIGFVSAGAYNLYVYGAASTEALATGKSYEETYDAFAADLKKEAPDPKNQWSFSNIDYMNARSKSVILTHPTAFLKTYLAGLNHSLFAGAYHFLLAKYGLIDVPERISFSFFLNDKGIAATATKFIPLIATPYFFLAAAGKILWFILVALSLFGAWKYRQSALALIFFVTLLYFAFTMISVTVGSEARHRYALNPLIFIFVAAALSDIWSRFRQWRNRV